MNNVRHSLRVCMQCRNHLTSDREYCALSSCTPPVENFNPEGGPEGADGQGVCTSHSGSLRSYQGLGGAGGLPSLSTLTNRQPNIDAIQKKRMLPITANAKSQSGVVHTSICVASVDSVNPLGHANRDRTGGAYVKKGSIVDFDGLRFRVQRVRLGTVYGETLYMKAPIVARCSQLRVVG